MDTRFKSFNGKVIVLYSKSKNYIYYNCSFTGCKGKYREDIHTKKIINYGAHSSKCYNMRKLKIDIIPTNHYINDTDNSKITINSFMLRIKRDKNCIKNHEFSEI